MAAAIYSTTNAEGVDINAVFLLDPSDPSYPRPPFLPGTIANGTDGSAWIYCTASITITNGSVVIVNATPGSWSVAQIGGATVATAPTGRFVGIVGGSQGSMVVPAPSGTQTGSFFWVQRLGNVPNIRTLATTTVSIQLYSSATLGGVVTGAAGGAATTYQVNGLVISQATGSAAGPNTGIANWPVVGSSA